MSEINKISNSVNLNANAVSNLGSVLSGDEAAAYQSFADAFEGSSISGSAQGNLLSAEVNNVLAAVGKAGTAIGAKFASETIAEGLVDAPDGIDEVAYVGDIDDGFATGVAYERHTLGVSQVVSLNEKECSKIPAGNAASCDVDVDLEIEIFLPDSNIAIITSDNTKPNLTFENLQVKVLSMTASNEFVSVSMDPATVILVGVDETGTGSDSLRVRAVLDGAYDGQPAPNLISADIVAANFTMPPFTLNVSDRAESGASLAVSVTALEIGVLSLSLDLSDSDNTVLAVNNLADASASANLSVTADGDTLVGNIAASSAFNGNGPFTFIFGETLERVGETASDFIGADVTASFTSMVNGSTLITGDLVGGRETDVTNKIDNWTSTYNGDTYVLSGEFDENGEVVSLEATNASTGIIIKVDTVAGVREGTVIDGLGTELGTIAENGDGKLEITYTDGSTQLL